MTPTGIVSALSRRGTALSGCGSTLTRSRACLAWSCSRLPGCITSLSGCSPALAWGTRRRGPVQNTTHLSGHIAARSDDSVRQRGHCSCSPKNRKRDGHRILDQILAGLVPQQARYVPES
jgi:hypothetical protein